MHFLALATAAASLASAVSAATITVAVGQNGLTYTPSNVTAAVGDVVAFNFFPKNHTVTQSSFASPCAPLASGISSGFQPVASGAATIPQWSFTVNDASKPLWFYCAQVGHCAGGMVFSVNAPATGNTFDAFQAAAKGGAATTSSGSSSAAAPAGSASAAAGGAVASAGGAVASAAAGAAASVSASAGAPAASTAGAMMTRAGGMSLIAAGVVAGLLL